MSDPPEVMIPVHRPLTAMPPPPARGGGDGLALRSVLGALADTDGTADGRRSVVAGRALSAERGRSSTGTHREEPGRGDVDLLKEVSDLVSRLTSAGEPIPVHVLAERCGLNFLRVVELVTMLERQHVVEVSGAPGCETVSLVAG